MKTLRWLEPLAWGVGLILIATWGGARLHGHLAAQDELERFESARRELQAANPADTRLWSEGRIAAYEQSLASPTDAPLAILRIERIGLEVAVLDGTDELTLNRAVGRIEGTSPPGEPGNAGIAGHRDGFFRGLKDVGLGDRIEIETLSGTSSYVIDTTLIVNPDQVDVLEPTEESVVTLVTCYPFYYVGPAPRRYIVRAVQTAAAAR